MRGEIMAPLLLRSVPALIALPNIAKAPVAGLF